LKKNHTTTKKNKKQSRFHRIIRKTISGASPPNLPKKQKTKSVPHNHQKSYFWGIPSPLAKKPKNKVGSTEPSENLFLGHSHPTSQKNKKQSQFHRIIRKTISVICNNLG
jgi:hypothetical protein